MTNLKIPVYNDGNCSIDGQMNYERQIKKNLC